LELDDIYFNLRNNRIEVKHDLPAVLNNEISNITFYDIDNDGIYSVGDEFYIDGDIVEPETDFHVIWSRNGKYIMGFDFEE
jgi:hypothetical protein